MPYLVSPRGMLVKDLIKRRSQLAKWAWIKLIERSNLEHAAAIHATSQGEAEELCRFNWCLPKIVVISNGVDDPENVETDKVSHDVRDLIDKQPLVLYLGRLNWKRVSIA